MRKPLVAGNWKMNKTAAAAVALIKDLVPLIQGIGDVEKVVCPPFTALMAVYPLLKGTDVGLGSQNLHWEKAGAFTGEESGEMIAEYCRYAIVGHSERRQYFNESDESANKRLLAGLEAGLIVIFCIGETLAEYESDKTEEVLRRQIAVGLKGITKERLSQLVVAYEPVWAIGTGKAATKDDANGVVKNVIRPAVQELYGKKAAHSVRVLYGGSVNGKNAAEYFSQSDIDGALVGGASLKPDDFSQIVRAASKSK